MSQESDTIIKNEIVNNNNHHSNNNNNKSCEYEEIQTKSRPSYLIVRSNNPDSTVTYESVDYHAPNKFRVQEQHQNSHEHEVIVKPDTVHTLIEMSDMHQTATPVVSSGITSTKTMILQSTGNEFHYITPPQQSPPHHQQIYTQHVLTQPSIAVTSDVIDRSDDVATCLVKNDRNDNNRTKLLIDAAASRFSVGIASLPPPPPPGVTITATRPISGNSLSLDQLAPSAGATGIVTYGRLSYKDDILYITEPSIEIGRNSSTSTVHFHVGKNSFVSRKHLQLLHDQNNNDFYLMCLSKNGVFVNDVFQRKSSEPLKLPKTCTFRFPSTNIRILFESFVDYPHEPPTKNNKTVENSNVIYAPLKITIPEQDKKSPFPSPTGTISAANSCPTSPRHNYQDYHHHLPIAASVYSSYNNSNINNNNITSTSNSSGPISLSSSSSKKIKFENDLFPPPSTSSFNEFEKPPYSYAQLIVQSISASSEKQLTLSGIYSFISKHYPYYRKEANKGWQNSIRHNLSLNRYFIKVARSQDEPGKGSFWRIDPNSEAKLIDQSYKKRRQRGSQCFRTPYGMPRSAPVSPSHMDNSAENSPLHDIVLQSAPGSPGAYHTIHHDNHSNEGSYIASDQLFKGSSSYSQTGSSYSTVSNVGSGIIGSSVVCSAGSSPPLNFKRRHVESYQPVYEEQTAPLQLQHTRIVNQSQAHQDEYGGDRMDSDDNDASYEDNEDDEEEYNHNIAKRHKYEADI